MKIIFAFLFVVPSLLFAAVVKHDVTLNGQKITVEVANDSTDIRILKEKKVIGEWKNRSLRVDTSKTVSVVKLSTKENTEYLLFAEEPEMYIYTSWIVGFNEQRKAVQVYAGPARGKLEDFNQDGLLDFLKLGGHGEPTSDNSGAYDPYLVYTQKRDGKEIGFEIDEDLSKKYSLSMGYQWHGPRYDSKIIVNQKTGKTVK